MLLSDREESHTISHCLYTINNMIADGENGLTGRRILVPPARPEANPLLHILQKHGAEVIEFPKLITAPPA